MPQFMTSDGVELSYAVDDFTTPWEQTDTLILLPPSMASKKRYYAWIPHLARYFRVVRLDMRGHGESQVPPVDADLSPKRHAQDVLELMADLGCDGPVHLAGASGGGFIAQVFAATFPEKVKSLALISTGSNPSKANFGSWLPGLRAKGVREFFGETIGTRFNLEATDPRLVEFYLDDIGRVDTEFLCRKIMADSDMDFGDLLPKIACPTLVLLPGTQSLLPESAVTELKSKIRNCEVKAYAGYSHTIADTAGDRCAIDLREFISKHFGLPALLGGVTEMPPEIAGD